jgi:hypothetical protein
MCRKQRAVYLFLHSLVSYLRTVFQKSFLLSCSLSVFTDIYGGMTVAVRTPMRHHVWRGTEKDWGESQVG